MTPEEALGIDQQARTGSPDDVAEIARTTRQVLELAGPRRGVDPSIRAAQVALYLYRNRPVDSPTREATHVGRSREDLARAAETGHCEVAGLRSIADLAPGGEIRVEIVGDVFWLPAEDREFVFEILDLVRRGPVQRSTRRL